MGQREVHLWLKELRYLMTEVATGGGSTSSPPCDFVSYGGAMVGFGQFGISYEII